MDSYPVLIVESWDVGPCKGCKACSHRNVFRLPPGVEAKVYAARCVDLLEAIGRQKVLRTTWGWGDPDGTLVLT